MPDRSYLLSYYLTLITVGLMAAVLGPALPGLAERTHSTLSAVSIVLAARPLGYLVGVLISGRLYDRLPGHPVLALGLVLAAVSLGLAPLSPWLGLLVAAIVVMGLADAMLDVGTNTLLPWVYGAKVGPYLNGMHFAFGIGALSAPLILALSLRWGGGLKGGFWIMSLAMLPVALILFRLPSPRHEAHASEKAAAPLDWKLAGLVMLLFACYGGSEGGFGNWIYSYARATGLATPGQAAYLNSLFWACLTLGRLAGIFLALRLPLEGILGVDAILAAASLGLILWMPHSQAALWAGSAGAGLFMASFFPTLLIYAGRRLAPGGRVTARMISLFFVGSTAGGIAVPWLIGQGFESLGPRLAVALVFASLSSMACLLAALILPAKLAEKPLVKPAA